MFIFYLQIRKAIYGKFSSSDKEYMLPGLAVTIAYHMAAFISVITLINDRVNKLTDRDYLAGTSRNLQKSVNVLTQTF